MNNVLRITNENNEARTNGGVLMVGRIMNKREMEAINNTTNTIDHDRFMNVVKFMHTEVPVTVAPIIKEVSEDIDTSMFAIVNENSRRLKELNKKRANKQIRNKKKEGIKSWITRIML